MTCPKSRFRRFHQPPVQFPFPSSGGPISKVQGGLPVCNRYLDRSCNAKVCSNVSIHHLKIPNLPGCTHHQVNLRWLISPNIFCASSVRWPASVASRLRFSRLKPEITATATPKGRADHQITSGKSGPGIIYWIPRQGFAI